MNSTRPVLEANALEIGYGSTVIQSNITFSVTPGEIVCVCGGSGCGKSTLMRTVATLLDPLGGSLKIGGVELVGSSAEDLSVIRRQLGVMFQSGALFGGLTVLENVMLPIETHTQLSRSVRREMAMSLLSAVFLEDHANKLPSELSGGMQKRAAIARALSLEPPIVLLDEPSAGLDPITSAELDMLIRRLARLARKTFLVVTHELPSIFEIADRIVFLDAVERTVTAVGPPSQLRENGPERVRRFLNRQPENADKEAA